ncbi:NLI interacting factor-like phosphatase-domain-containing protein [Kockiozyma suomiensis]|uniref:NLI interacting factor-like phosphatase-domain-containing protein n=1 Tax=Kockiozyma suomiensis TaxID=1337062 RepID=UPI003344347F
MVDEMAGNKSSAKPESEKSQEESAAGEQQTSQEGAENAERPQYAGTAKRADYQGNRDRVRTRRLLWGFFTVSVFSGVTTMYLCRNWDDEEFFAHRDIPNGYTPDLMYKRFHARYDGLTTYYAGPAIEPELPEMPKDDNMMLPRYTLVVGVEDLLVHSEWTRQNGWRTYMRPGWDYFLMYLSQYYEIVLFSSESVNFAERMVMKLDPYHAYLTHAFFRESTSYIDGKIVKDITNMNRDLGKVIMLDVNEDAYSKQPHNGIPVKKWTGDKTDRELVKLIPMLEYIAVSMPKDVRKVLQTFEGTDDYAAEYLRREKEHRAKIYKRWEEQKATTTPLKFIAQMFGLSSAVSDKPVIFQDVIRQDGIRNYENMKKFLEENGEKMLEEEKQKEKEFLASQNFTLGTVLQGVVDPSSAPGAVPAPPTQSQ